ncbi:hypothetical protein NTCA1_03900 [Novosphingobium sp. TCA1]|nr:hypothetical protein NTCA1_03900 [Novosphingobium sp. TCA1]
MRGKNGKSGLRKGAEVLQVAVNYLAEIAALEMSEALQHERALCASARTTLPFYPQRRPQC